MNWSVPPSNVRIRLQALNALTFIGEPARQALSEIKLQFATTISTSRAPRAISVSCSKGAYTPASQIYVGPAARQS